MRKRIACSWSGGKDSCHALVKAVANDCELVVLLNVMNENGKISRSHGLPLSILEQQAKALGVPLVTIKSSWTDYEANFIDTLKQLKIDYNIDAVVFGDIDLQVHRDWEEKVCEAAKLDALLPIWERNRIELAHEMIAEGIHAKIVSCNAVLGEKFIGRLFDKTLINDCTQIGVDECGENGEFHTAVFDCSLFSNAIELDIPKAIEHNNYWFVDWKN